MATSRPRAHWIRCVGTIEGLRRGDGYEAHLDRSHERAVRRPVRDLDGEEWLGPQDVVGIAVIVELTRDGQSHAGAPVRTPVPVVHSRVDSDHELRVSSRVAVEDLLPLTADEREAFWFDWYWEILASVGRRRGWGVPRPRSADDPAGLVDLDGDDAMVEDQAEPSATWRLELRIPVTAPHEHDDIPWPDLFPYLVGRTDGAELDEIESTADLDEAVARMRAPGRTPLVNAAEELLSVPGVPATAYAVIVDPQGVRERLPARASRRSD